MKKLALLAILICLILPGSVAAQGEYRADISKPDLHSFPLVGLTMTLYQPDGAFIHGLQSESIRVLEDGTALTPASVQEVRIGLQTSVVINAGPTFASRNSRGISRYDVMKTYLETWAGAQKEINIDDLSLFTNGGTQQTHLDNSQAWLTGLVTYQPDLKAAVPSLDPLGSAIQAAIDTQFPSPMHRAILYLTPPPGDEMTDAVREDLISRANTAGVTIHIWMLSSKNDFSSAGAGHLRIIAEKTGGQFFAFSGNEALPEAQTLLEPLRYLYQISYASKIQKGGTHSLAARINLQESTVTSNPLPFDITLEPVVPIFISSPASIQRTAPQNSENPTEVLTPNGIQVGFLLQFPDNLRRSLASASLMVDGKEASRNTEAPFTQFYWDLRPYSTSGRHVLQVQVIDELGIASQSSELPVEIEVIIPEKTGFQKFIAGDGIYLVLLGVFVLGAAFAMIILRLRTRPTGGQTPSTQANTSRGLAAPQPASDSPSGWYAELLPLDDQMERTNLPALRLTESAVSWGSDPERASLQVDDELLEPLHCRCWFGDDQRYHIAAVDPRADVWLNFHPLPVQDSTLTHGDILQFGNLTYKYVETPPRNLKILEVLPYNIQQ
jgi:hypothetical protein